ncbi:MAG TPA: FliH/SctL family protein [Xanthobacteraceae bacterium]|nr:FliH/SctL family protein [Xanthobacteraceae bacterium]
MTARSKFMFDADFGASAPPPKVDLARHQAEIAEAEARGYRNGVNAAEAQARTEAERRTAAALEGIGGAVERFVANLSAIERKLEIEAVEVAEAVAKKLARELVAREPLAEIAALATTCLSELRSAPHIAVRVHESLHAQVQAQLSEIAAMRGFEGRLVVLGESDIAPGDCRLEWADGGVVRDRAKSEALIDEAVARYVAARAPHGGNLGDS